MNLHLPAQEAELLGRAKVIVAAFSALLIPIVALADPGGHGDRLHFSHPLVAESPSPDTKIRTDYIFGDDSGEEGAETHTARLEAEYLVRPWISIEANIPFTLRDPDGGRRASHLDTLEVGIKLASFSLERHGVLLGGGIEFGLPTGDGGKEIGSSHVFEVEPFLDFGVEREDLEVVGFLSPAIPTNQNGEDGADVELGWNVSFLYHLSQRVDALLEFGGERVFGGEESGLSTASVVPGIKISPTANRSWKVGAGVSIPISEGQDFDVGTIFSVFYHF